MCDWHIGWQFFDLLEDAERDRNRHVITGAMNLEPRVVRWSGFGNDSPLTH